MPTSSEFMKRTMPWRGGYCIYAGSMPSHRGATLANVKPDLGFTYQGQRSKHPNGMCMDLNHVSPNSLILCMPRGVPEIN